MSRKIMKLTKSKEKGFTLNELIIILAVIAVLAAVVILAFSGIFGRGSEEALAADARVIQAAVFAFRSDLHRGPADGDWGEGSDGHYFSTDDGLTGALTKANFPIHAGDIDPASTLDGIIWMGLLANSPRDGGGNSPATAAPMSNEEGPYLDEIPESSSTYNGNVHKSGPYTWIILSEGNVVAVELVSDYWVLVGDILVGPTASSSPTPSLPLPTSLPTTCILTLDSTDGGLVTNPGEGVFEFPVGEEVDLLAVPDECRDFVKWTGDVDTITDASASETKIIMDGDYSITANFATTEIVRLNISVVNPEINAWIRIQNKSGDVAEDKYGVAVDGTHHQTPADIWISRLVLEGEYYVLLRKPLMDWEKEVQLPQVSESACSVTLEVEYDGQMN